MDGVSTLASIMEFKAYLEKIDPTNSNIDDYVVLACLGIMQGHVNVDCKDKDGIHRAGSKVLKGLSHVRKMFKLDVYRRAKLKPRLSY